MVSCRSRTPVHLHQHLLLQDKFLFTALDDDWLNFFVKSKSFRRETLLVQVKRAAHYEPYIMKGFKNEFVFS